MRSTPAVITKVVSEGLCTGCGACAASCDSNALSISFDRDGFLVASQVKDCFLENDCLKACPFNPDLLLTEKELAEEKIKTNSYHKSIGYYRELYAGFSSEHRVNSSSGGIATFVSKYLLDNSIVDSVVSVRASDTPGKHYEYAICSSSTDLEKHSKTKYYPVTMHEVLNKIKDSNKLFAIVSIPCFLKSIQLLKLENKEKYSNIIFTIGIICGGLKSKGFTEYLASRSKCDSKNYYSPEYRIKDSNSLASDYSFSCKDLNNNLKIIKMRSIGDLWGTGLFKAKACDFCQDVTAELADISLGDAWIEPYNSDGNGNNIIIARSQLAQTIIKNGIKNDELQIKKMTPTDIIKSQQGSFNHRIESYTERRIIYKTIGEKTIKRKGKLFLSPDTFFLQVLRLISRKKSIQYWNQLKNSEKFDVKMRPLLAIMKLTSKVVNKRRKYLYNTKWD